MFLTFMLSNFLLRTLQYFFKKLKKIFLPTKSWINHPLKLLRKPLFFLTALSCPNIRNRRIHVPNCDLYINCIYNWGSFLNPAKFSFSFEGMWTDLLRQLRSLHVCRILFPLFFSVQGEASLLAVATKVDCWTLGC